MRLPYGTPAMSEILVPVSFGELLDKIAILQIKSERMTDAAKLANVRAELSALERTWMAHPAAGKDIVRLRAELKAVNERLWVIEDDIRLQEKAQAFDDEFVRLARAVYFENDTRARVKKDINLALGAIDAPVPQVPQYSPIRFAGHESGEFFFLPKGAGSRSGP